MVTSGVCAGETPRCCHAASVPHRWLLSWSLRVTVGLSRLACALVPGWAGMGHACMFVGDDVSTTQTSMV